MKAVKSNKTHLVFPKDLLETIDELVGKRKRSRFVVEAAREKLAKERFLEVMGKTAVAWTDKNHPKLRTKGDVDRYIRTQRKSFGRRLKTIYE